MDHANVVAPPPLIFLAGILVALGLEELAPIEVALPAWAGMVLVGLALVVFLWSLSRFLRAGTPVSPHRPTRTLITSGPYRVSRNPLYVALTGTQTGIALWTDNAWMLGMLLPLLFVMRYGVIAREERYLEARFGAAYLEYKRRVRRWL
jgi:protein-S-isoprenylcysteine O-methyltransferase Ste14